MAKSDYFFYIWGVALLFYSRQHEKWYATKLYAIGEANKSFIAWAMSFFELSLLKPITGTFVVFRTLKTYVSGYSLWTENENSYSKFCFVFL